MDGEAELIHRAARFLVGAIVEPDDVRRQSLVTTAVDAMIGIVRSRTGSDCIPRDAAEMVQGEVMAIVCEHLLGIATTAAPMMAGLASEAEIRRVWKDALAAASPIKQ
jgi:hypothetical protein